MLGLSPIPFWAPKQRFLSVSFHLPLIFHCWPVGELRCPLDNTKGLKSASFFSAVKRMKECKLLSSAVGGSVMKDRIAFGIPRLFSPPLAFTAIPPRYKT